MKTSTLLFFPFLFVFLIKYDIKDMNLRKCACWYYLSAYRTVSHKIHHCIHPLAYLREDSKTFPLAKHIHHLTCALAEKTPKLVRSSSLFDSSLSLSELPLLLFTWKYLLLCIPQLCPWEFLRYYLQDDLFTAWTSNFVQKLYVVHLIVRFNFYVISLTMLIGWGLKLRLIKKREKIVS